jgi:hypothetical protein
VGLPEGRFNLGLSQVTGDRLQVMERRGAEWRTILKS